MTDELEALRARCDRFLTHHGIRPAETFLADIATEEGLDTYGEGGAVAALEAHVGQLLGKPAAVFMPSGTMAQQIALRIHADRRSERSVGFHPTSHIELFEQKAYQRLHGLIGIPTGNERTLITRSDLEAIREPLAAFLFELPQREIGGRLPSWNDLTDQVGYLRERGIALHLDGARLWECTPYYGKTSAEIAALFDTVYVSFYKGIGALSGCCLAGEADVIDEARIWRRRHGGTLYSLWPLAASAIGAMRKRLPKMPAYYEHAVAIAAALRDLPNLEVVRDPPQVPMMHLHMRIPAERFDAAVRTLAEEEGIWTWKSSSPTDTPSIQTAELTVGDATLEFSPAEVAKIIERFVA